MSYGNGPTLRASKGGLPFLAASMGAGFLKKGLAKAGAMVAKKAAMPGGALMTIGAAGAAGAGMKAAGTAVAKRAAFPVPGGTMRPLAAAPGGIPLFSPKRKYRRMNAGNVKALKRAMRRQDAFIKLANDALKGSGYSVKRTKAQVAPRKKGRCC